MRRVLIPIVFIAILAGACGSNDSGDTTTTEAAMETSTTTEAAMETSTTTEAAMETTTTEMATTTTAETGIPTEPIVPGADADADAIADAYLVVFDSSTSYDDKAPLIDDPSGLEATVDAYTNAGDGVGGILLQATAVGVDGDDATVVYDLLFAGNPFQTDLVGDAVRNDGTWQVTREFFCSIMELARVGCP